MGACTSTPQEMPDRDPEVEKKIKAIEQERTARRANSDVYKRPIPPNGEGGFLPEFKPPLVPAKPSTAPKEVKPSSAAAAAPPAEPQQEPVSEAKVAAPPAAAIAPAEAASPVVSPAPSTVASPSGSPENEKANVLGLFYNPAADTSAPEPVAPQRQVRLKQKQKTGAVAKVLATVVTGAAVTVAGKIATNAVQNARGPKAEKKPEKPEKKQAKICLPKVLGGKEVCIKLPDAPRNPLARVKQ